jgi:hypothetical protein
VTIPLHYEAKKAGLVESIKTMVATFGADEVLAAVLDATGPDRPRTLRVLDVLRTHRGATMNVEGVTGLVGLRAGDPHDRSRVRRSLCSLQVIGLVACEESLMGPSRDLWRLLHDGESPSTPLCRAPAPPPHDHELNYCRLPQGHELVGEWHQDGDRLRWPVSP